MGEYMGTRYSFFHLSQSRRTHLQFKMKIVIVIAPIAAVAAAPAELETKAPVAIIRSASETTLMEVTALASKLRMVPRLKKVDPRNWSDLNPKTSVPLPRVLILTLETIILSSQSTGLPMKMVSKPQVITYPLLPRCLSMSSKCWPT